MKIITTRLDVVSGFISIITYLNEPDVENWKEFCDSIKKAHPDLDKQVIKEGDLYGLKVTIFEKCSKVEVKPIDSNLGNKKEKKKVRGDDFDDIDFEKYDVDDFYKSNKKKK